MVGRTSLSWTAATLGKQSNGETRTVTRAAVAADMVLFADKKDLRMGRKVFPKSAFSNIYQT